MCEWMLGGSNPPVPTKGEGMATEVDKSFLDWIIWLKENASRREMDLIYVTENYSKAWLTASDIRMGRKPNLYDLKQLKKVNLALKRLNYPILQTIK